MGALSDSLKTEAEDTKPSLPAKIDRKSPVAAATAPQQPEPMSSGSKKLLISVDLDTHSELKVIAARRRTTLEIACRDLLVAATKALK